MSHDAENVIPSKIPYGTLVPIVSLWELRFIPLTSTDLNSADLSEVLPLIMNMLLRFGSYNFHWLLRENSSGFLFQYKQVIPT